MSSARFYSRHLEVYLTRILTWHLLLSERKDAPATYRKHYVELQAEFQTFLETRKVGPLGLWET